MITISKPIIGKEEENIVLEVLRSGRLAQGEKVEEFAAKFAKYIDIKYAIATNSGTSALHTALLACGIGKNDEIITTPFTFIASTNSIVFCGAKPIFVDIAEESFNIDVNLIEKKITKKTKAIMPVHLFGNPCDIKSIKKIADNHNLSLIEDCCQSHGAEINSRKVGSFGVGCFSFYPTKNVTTGEGGMITINSKEIADKCKMIINHGSKVRNRHEFIGYNYRMNEITAAIGIEQLKKIQLFTNIRIKNAKYLTKNLSKLSWLLTPKVKNGYKHVFNQYTIRIIGKDRDYVANTLEKKGIQTSIYYPLPVTLQKPYEQLKVRMPISEKIANQVLSIPVHPSLSKDDLDYIIQIFEEL